MSLRGVGNDPLAAKDGDEGRIQYPALGEDKTPEPASDSGVRWEPRGPDPPGTQMEGLHQSLHRHPNHKPALV